MTRHDHRRNVLQILAFTLGIAAALILLLVPGYTEVTQTNDGQEKIKSSTLLETIGPWILRPLFIPVVLTGLPLLFRGPLRKYASVTATVALAIFTLLGSLSMGWFYLPATVVSFIALFSLSTKPKSPKSQSRTRVLIIHPSIQPDRVANRHWAVASHVLRVPSPAFSQQAALCCADHLRRKIWTGTQAATPIQEGACKDGH